MHTEPELILLEKELNSSNVRVTLALIEVVIVALMFRSSGQAVSYPSGARSQSGTAPLGHPDVDDVVSLPGVELPESVEPLGVVPGLLPPMDVVPVPLDPIDVVSVLLDPMDVVPVPLPPIIGDPEELTSVLPMDPPVLDPVSTDSSLLEPFGKQLVRFMLPESEDWSEFVSSLGIGSSGDPAVAPDVAPSAGPDVAGAGGIVAVPDVTGAGGIVADPGVAEAGGTFAGPDVAGAGGIVAGPDVAGAGGIVAGPGIDPIGPLACMVANEMTIKNEVICSLAMLTVV